jgi:hypothetical protein
LPVVAQNQTETASTHICSKGGGGGHWLLLLSSIGDVDVDDFGVVDSDQQSHMITHLTGISAARYP